MENSYRVWDINVPAPCTGLARARGLTSLPTAFLRTRLTFHAGKVRPSDEVRIGSRELPWLEFTFIGWVQQHSGPAGLVDSAFDEI
jgi:hypothetical protein